MTPERSEYTADTFAKGVRERQESGERYFRDWFYDTFQRTYKPNGMAAKIIFNLWDGNGTNSKGEAIELGRDIIQSWEGL